MTTFETKRPTHRVYAVRKTGRDQSHWAEIGAAWPNGDGKGFTLRLHLMPLGNDDIVMREISADTKATGGAQ